MLQTFSPVFPAVQCSGGQVYQECGRVCGNSCSESWSCDNGGIGLRMCVPGCQCPPGLVQDHQGQCVPITMCPCVQRDKMYLPGSVTQNNCNTWYVAARNCSWDFTHLFKSGISKVKVLYYSTGGNCYAASVHIMTDRQEKDTKGYRQDTKRQHQQQHYQIKIKIWS